MVEIDIKKLSKAAEVRMWRGLCIRLKSGGAPIIVPVLDVAQPRPSGVASTDAGVPHRDGAPFSDGARYTSRLISYELQGASRLRATTLTLHRTAGGALKGGEFFTLTGPTYGDRLYAVGAVTSVAGDIFTISFLPPLREDYADGTFADFQNPRCTMKLSASAIDSIWPKIERPYRGQPSTTFEETFS